MNRRITTIGLGALAFSMTAINANAMEKGSVNTSALNIRSGPSTNYSKIDKVYKGSIVEILEKSNGWYKVKLSNGKIGWGSGQYIDINKTQVSPSQPNVVGNKGKVTANPRLNIRSGPNTNSSILMKANYGEIVEILETSNGWYKLKMANGNVGWGSSDYVVKINSSTGNNNTNNNGNTTNPPPPPTTQPPQEINRDAVVKLAYELIGTPYEWGGNGPDNFDCSGFTKYVYSKAEGKNIPRVSREQANYGVGVSKESLLEGDLVYFDTNGDGVVNHVGVYVGGNEFIHASGTPTNPEAVKKENLGTSYWNKVFKGVRRF